MVGPGEEKQNVGGGGSDNSSKTGSVHLHKGAREGLC